ncbi:cupin domain-containing protein [Nocardioides marmotae]|uniref:cupin domain-containing protein n=1 Tax=Nocardioides marmotae TaxID=2663857 RepID=UPI00293431D1|nr:cupin domain-containing protein [Nocardioides marmotae]
MTEVHAASLGPLVEEHLALARSAEAGRSSHTTYGGQEHRLRQTLIALAAGRSLGEHEAPGEATLQVLRGSVRLHAGTETWEGQEGDLLIVPSVRHDLEAVTDAAVLLTVVTGTRDAH